MKRPIIILFCVALTYFFLKQKEEEYEMDPEQEKAQTKPTSNSYYTTYKTKEEKKVGPSEPPNPPAEAIPNQAVLHFSNDKNWEDFKAPKGSHILSSNPIQKTRLLQFTDASQLQQLFTDNPDLEMSYNTPIRAPSPEEIPAIEEELNLIPFQGSTLDWLGVSEASSTWGQGIKVAVLDSGIENHPSLSNTSIQENTVIEGGSYVPGAHGTAVASLIVGNGDNGVQGLAPAADILSYQVLDDSGKGDAYTLSQAIYQAVKDGAHIINMSLGADTDSPILKQAVQYANSHGVAMVASTGNDSSNEVSYPAAYEGVIAVGAIDASGLHAGFSNRGSEVDITAPGVGIYSAWDQSQYAAFSGTSASTPIVSGALASILSTNPSLSVEQATQMLYTYSNDTGYPGSDSEYGHGSLNIGRILNRNQTGVHDVALSGLYLNETSTSGALYRDLLIGIENRGTAWETASHIKVQYGDKNKTFLIQNLKINDTQSVSLPIPLLSLQSETGIQIQVEVVGEQDTDPLNNKKARNYKITP